MTKLLKDSLLFQLALLVPAIYFVANSGWGAVLANAPVN